MQQERVGDTPESAQPCEERVAPRFTLLIRAAKLVDPRGQFVCVIRDVSTSGVSLRAFHALPGGEDQWLELQTGERYPIDQVWNRGTEAGYSFREAVEVDELIAEAGRFPKRQLRLDFGFRVHISVLGRLVEAEIVNLSQQGARIDCGYMFALDQPVRIVSDLLPAIGAKIRWRDGRIFGLVFDDTFNLRELALVAARMQCPELLGPPPCATSQRQA